MFVQIHMIQSMPPGNLNRDETGQPKKCLFGGVTRGRISSQCLKRNIRHSVQFKEAFGDNLADRTLSLPGMVADAIRQNHKEIPEDEQRDLMAAIASKFKKEKKKAESEEDEDAEDDEQTEGAAGALDESPDADKTGQLVFFPPPFAERIAELLATMRQADQPAYQFLLGRKSKGKRSKDEEKALKAKCEKLFKDVAEASQNLTVDIGLFGRMTTSDLVVNVEAACQVAHALSTHETIIESDYFTAMDDRKAGVGAAFMGSGETETFFNAAVYYKYLNVDLDALRKHLPSLAGADAARVASVLVCAAALANPTGKQNSFAAHGVPELILVELSKAKRPLSYANAFLQPVEGGMGRNLLTESAHAFCAYVDAIGPAFAPSDVRRLLFTTGAAAPASLTAAAAERVASLDKLAALVASGAAA